MPTLDPEDLPARYQWTVRDDDLRAEFKIEIHEEGILIGMQGYGVSGAEFGFPVLVSLSNAGTPKVSVWADILDEEPTHEIYLGGAAEAIKTVHETTKED